MTSSEMTGEKPKKEKKQRKPFSVAVRERGFLRPVFLFFLSLFATSVLLYVLCRLIPDLAEFWARYPSHWIRFVLAKITTWIPFSVAEWFVFSSPLLAVGYFVFSGKSLKKNDTAQNYHRWLNPLLCGLMTIVVLFCTAIGPCYFRHSLADNLGLKDEEVSPEQLKKTAEIVSGELKKLEGKISYLSDGSSIRPYGYDEMIDRILASYDDFCADEKHSFIRTFSSSPKRLASSKIFTYTHISGVYSFITGEANINLNYPDFIRPFTVAHELAHQRGIAKEEEANMIAFLICINSSDDYIRYSGYTAMLQYLMDALHAADQKLESAAYAEFIPMTYRQEMKAYSEFFRPYAQSTASKVVSAVNSTYLNSQGEKKGTASYGLVVDLAVAYYSNTNINTQE